MVVIGGNLGFICFIEHGYQITKLASEVLKAIYNLISTSVVCTFKCLLCIHAAHPGNYDSGFTTNDHGYSIAHAIFPQDGLERITEVIVCLSDGLVPPDSFQTGGSM